VVEGYLRQSALAHLGLEGRAAAARGEAGVAMAEMPPRGIVNLRIRRDDAEARAAFEAAFGFALPAEPNTAAGSGGTTALWLGPDEWWILAPGAEPDAGQAGARRLHEALGGHLCAITDVGESRTCIQVAGPRARDLLQKGSPLDFHPRAFTPGTCAQSVLAKATVVVHLVEDGGADGPAFDIYVLRSFADYLWRWLEDAAGEYGLAVVEG
jgi:sarcosine oxidase subunit gamma